MIKKLLFAAPLALAAGALFTAPESAHDYGTRPVRHTEVVRVVDTGRRDRNGGRECRHRHARHERYERHHRDDRDGRYDRR